jgi:ABC-type Fe3+-hydroxamate transport system substrate-binding protein
MKQIATFLSLLLMLLALTGCVGKSNADSPPAGSLPFENVEESEWPADVKQWVESVIADGTQPKNESKDFGEKTYLLVYAGERSTGGYTITFSSVAPENGEIEVKAQITAPSGPATMAITYPVGVARIGKQAKAITFTVTEKK